MFGGFSKDERLDDLVPELGPQRCETRKLYAIRSASKKSFDLLFVLNVIQWAHVVGFPVHKTHLNAVGIKQC